MLKIIAFCISLLTILDCRATDTTRLVRPTDITAFKDSVADNTIFVSNKYFQAPGHGYDDGLFNFLLLNQAPWKVQFNRCRFGSFANDIQPSLLEVPRHRFAFGECNIDYISFKKMAAFVDIYSSKMRTLTIDSCDHSEFTFNGDSAIEFMVVNNCRDIKLSFQNLRHIDTFAIRIFNSTIKQVDFIGMDSTHFNQFHFEDDTVNLMSFASAVDSFPHYKFSGLYNNVFEFKRCHFNGDLTFWSRMPNAKIIFSDCTFGPDCYIGDLVVDRLALRNCHNIGVPLFIGFREDTIPAELEIVNTDLGNLKLDWHDNMRLAFGPYDSEDTRDNTFENLIAKFEAEGKHNGLKAVDIQYHEMSQAKWASFLQKAWWNYGYDKNRVFWWSLLSLAVFCFANFIGWKGMQDTYPMFDLKTNHNWRFPKEAGKPAQVLLYTIFIFFSLRINFEKLKIARLGFVALFFFQYLTGLFCLLFIFKAVLKW